ncbi:TPA: hypothetical protein ACYS2D_002255 [Staphylococcus aureus]|uniref:hypothetical protein n=1 Tax=Staphylococcus TaxID=1279 RepID=UPI00024320A1|nr:MULTISPECIES: hypothetical protein [Staphylococcus]AKJ48638.1 extracellular matrix and plasma binding protein [Staphylococcus aureus]AUJ55082.1 hypothetical protein B7473_10655 [Staphylococcus aureus]AUJ56701.1 hypothetical protein B7474_04775 [Staphylococcus aureus]AUW98476.1 hypothetical protein B7R57_04745 [Staphylococcus aureus]AVS42215.1 hypothetical protein C9J90_13135 [Staphylococcus aureus]
MKRKVLVLTMGVICATQLWHSNHANALVTESVETKQFTEIVSEEKVITVEHAQINIFQSNSNSNLMEFNILTMGGKSGAMVGYSEIDSSHFTDRDKRVIRRDHVKEAQSLINDYKDTQSYEDLAKATAKVSTLSQSHQNYLNKQIDKVNNKIEKTEKR